MPCFEQNRVTWSVVTPAVSSSSPKSSSKFCLEIFLMYFIQPDSHTLIPHLTETINYLKRKEMDEVSMLQEKGKVMKLVKDIVKDLAGPVQSVDSENGAQFTLRVSRICEMITSISTKPSTSVAFKQREPDS